MNYHTLLLDNGSINNGLTLTMQNIDDTQENTVQLTANKKNSRQNYIKHLNRGAGGALTQDILEIEKRREKDKINFSLGKGNFKKNVNHGRRTEVSKEKNDVITLCNKILQILSMNRMTSRVIYIIQQGITPT